MCALRGSFSLRQAFSDGLNKEPEACERKRLNVINSDVTVVLKGPDIYLDLRPEPPDSAEDL